MVNNTVTHGTDDSGLSADRPGISGGKGSRVQPNDGHQWYDQGLREEMIYDATLKLWVPVSNSILWSTASPRYIFDDFKGAAIDARWDLNSGSDAEALDPAHQAATPAGSVRCVSGNSGVSMAADGSALGAALSFKASEQDGLRFFIKVKLDVITSAWYFLGFTDVLPSTTLEEPISLSGTTITSAATDAAGFLFDTDATVDNVWCVGVANDVDVTQVDSGLAPVAATFRTYELVINTAGQGKFFIDGTLVATIALVVTPTVNLTPYIAVNGRTTSSRILDGDWLLGT